MRHENAYPELPGYTLTRRQALEEARCHDSGYGAAIAGILQGIQRRVLSNKANATALSAAAIGSHKPGSPYSFTPTASNAQDQPSLGQQNIDQMGLKDLVQGQSFADYQKQNSPFSPEAKPADVAPAVGSDLKDFDIANAGNGPNIRTNEDLTVPQAQESAGGGLSTNDYLSAAGTAGSLAAQLAQRRPAPPANIPQPGQMNFQPTALSFLARRGPYGG